MAEEKQKRYNYEAICDNQSCKVKGVMQHYKSNNLKETIECVSCNGEITLTLVKVDLVMYQGGIEE
jgi:Zn ribbon nucleic-acid-binding protein